jgi:hypothetical protein
MFPELFHVPHSIQVSPVRSCSHHDCNTWSDTSLNIVDDPMLRRCSTCGINGMVMCQRA